MAKKPENDLFQSLRARGLRRKVAKSLAGLEGNSRRAGSKGQKRASQAVEDLTSAVEDIRKRVLRTDSSRSKAAAKAAQTRARKTAKRSASAKKAAQTRTRVARTRAKSTR